MRQQFAKKIIFKFKDGAFVGYGVGMRYRAFVTGFGYQNTTGVGIERTPEYIKQKIALAYKADAKRFAVFRFRRTAIDTPAFEIHNAVKI